MPVIRKAYAQDFERVLPLMQTFINPLLKADDWRALFTPHWDAPYDHFGYIIEENGEAVGFLGTIFSRRMINGQRRDFCNMSTWYVKEEYRSTGLIMLFELLKLKDVTITNFTAYHVADLLHKAGFKDLSASIKVFLPAPAGLFSGVRVETNNARIETCLQGDLLTIHRDHAPLKCRQALLEAGGGQCLLIFDVVKRKKLPVARLHYLSDPGFFGRYVNRFVLPFCRKNKLFALFVPENLLKGAPARAHLSIPQRQTQLYKSADLHAGDIDALYSELQLLGLKH
jgi:hypothetical protein